MEKCFSYSRSLYRLYDPDPTQNGCHHVKDWSECDQWNQKKWGVFWTVNEFDGTRQIKNLKRIISWAVDIDDGTKEEQRARIKKYPTPTWIVETKRGYQIYFHTNDATIENHKEIQDRLMIAYGGDKNAKDIARILRAPFYYHWKDSENPYLVKIAHHSDNLFKEKNMLDFFLKPEDKKNLEQKNIAKKELSFLKNENIFDIIYSLDCEQALLRLSGHACVFNEVYSFKRNSNGKLNLIVNGKGTSVFIDENKRIGSSDKGGPTVFQWINWFHKDYKKTYKYFKEIFPEVFIERV